MLNLPFSLTLELQGNTQYKQFFIFTTCKYKKEFWIELTLFCEKKKSNGDLNTC